jgi:hypothetical protein
MAKGSREKRAASASDHAAMDRGSMLRYIRFIKSHSTGLPLGNSIHVFPAGSNPAGTPAH